jgi:hypothetical protein
MFFRSLKADASSVIAGGEGYEKSGLDLTTYGGVIKGTKVRLDDRAR